MTNTYNGWTNYETWVIKIWIDNDPYTHDYFNEEAELFEGDVHGFAEFIENYHEDLKPEIEGPFADLLNDSLSSVNWYEIAESILED